MLKPIVLAAALALTCAWANPFPSDATLFVTDGRGTIVGVGQLVDGASFDLELVAGFDGEVKLTFVTTEGRVVVLDAVVDEGQLLLGLVDVATVAAEAGFSRVRVAPPGGLADAEASDPASDAGRANASGVGRERAGDEPNERSDLGGGDADDRRGPPIEPPGRAGDPPAGPPDGGPAGPPDGTPAGPPDGDPVGPPAELPVGPPAELPVEPEVPLVEPDVDPQQP